MSINLATLAPVDKKDGPSAPADVHLSLGLSATTKNNNVADTGCVRDAAVASCDHLVTKGSFGRALSRHGIPQTACLRGDVWRSRRWLPLQRGDLPTARSSRGDEAAVRGAVQQQARRRVGRGRTGVKGAAEINRDAEALKWPRPNPLQRFMGRCNGS